ncbi:zinc finger matrin-type protein 3-like isoform X2 [Tribolium madens]|uniref:zinc finger matrin-type protein 3-like isoform X2 n=1 Tax=Tribolium madens TaxID=41895 RepID=UPI001CF72FDD|nr:zinc finger matrin-type protein 3-like isoform X2 [Tribolium madens]
MQTSEDGEYIPSKELDKNFKIPKRKLSLDESGPASQQVMENSYYNYMVDPQPPVVAPIEVEAARNLILQSLQKRECEKPKTYQNHVLKDTIPDCFDETLPRELTSLFQPLYCKLCSAQLSSNLVAKLHYKSKNHEKKIRKFLIEYSERTGEPLHKRAKVAREGDSDDSNPLYYYCDVCDLPLTGKLHAESHYLGKNHRKATLGMKTPAGKGHYDPTGKWKRESCSNSTSDGFGSDFHPEQPPVAGFRCELCNITTTCQEQLESHYNGQKHRKKLKQQAGDLAPVGSPHDSILTSVLTADAGDCSVYRTPSGQYYCQTCDCSTNSEVQFKQHLHSKNHLKKASQKKA